MFDTITCEYPLPIPEDAKDLEFPPDWASEKFQTKSFDSILTDYSIEEDGQIYRNVVDREIVQSEKGGLKIEEVDQGVERVDFTGEVRFYTILLESELDHWVEFVALYCKGDLKEIELAKWEKMDNSDRVKIQFELDHQLDESVERKKKWWYKPKQKFAFLVRAILFLIRWPIGLIARLTWKIERWLIT